MPQIRSAGRLTAQYFLTPALLALSLALACGGDSQTSNTIITPGGGNIYEVEIVNVGEKFRIKVESSLVAQADSVVRAGGRKIVNGELAAGDGGFNAPYQWHMKPSTIEFVDVAIEVCDGTPSGVDRALNYWINTIKRFCPWGSRVIGRVSQ